VFGVVGKLVKNVVYFCKKKNNFKTSLLSINIKRPL
jgi:hypothetical protein